MWVPTTQCGSSTLSSTVSTWLGPGSNERSRKRRRRPGYDPSDLLKLYIYGYLNRVRSSRRLEAKTHRLIAEQQVHSQVSDLRLLAETGRAARTSLGVERIDAVADKGYFKVGRFFRQLLLSSDGSPRWRRIGSLSKQTKGMPPDL